MEILTITMALERIIDLALGLILFLLAMWAFVSALGASDHAYQYSFKRTKKFWVLVTGACLLAAVISMLGALRGGSSSLFLQLIAASAVGVFLADVRPAVRTRK
ncbi:DUF2516 family protein [Rothia sp. HC945]|uniref:DUF2516 family protein n=1 Tax=Rothia sp. HC945 TaxID=3171170 RepID=UPI002654A3AE|nr:DUF2516 family protein [Kocuria sp.]MDN5616986.1 DUF2516 family protein [Kocuria sp.]MDN5655528.1 DUF2516 family protein [Kocuria sp.]